MTPFDFNLHKLVANGLHRKPICTYCDDTNVFLVYIEDIKHNFSSLIWFCNEHYLYHLYTCKDTINYHQLNEQDLFTVRLLLK